MSRTCRIGVHGRNNVNFEASDYDVIRHSRVEAIKMMSQTNPDVLRRVKEVNSDIEIITRLYDDRIGTGHHPSPQEFADRMIPIMKNYQPYCQKFHLLNEPNHVHRYEGWGSTDDDARNFNQWFLEAYDRLKQALPWAQLGFPGLALPDFGHRDRAWLNICRPAIEKADWLGCHCYWQTPNDGNPSVIFHENFGLNFKFYHQQYPDKVIEILECGNSNCQNNIPISDQDVAREFGDWLNEVFKYPYINSVAYFLLSSQDTGNWEFFAWRKEDGYVKPIVDKVANLPRPERRGAIARSQKPPAPVKKEIEAKQPSKETGVSAEPGSFTNQNMVDAMYNVGKALGVEPAPWGLLTQAGLTLGGLVGAGRDNPYSGASISQLNLNPEERRLVREELGVLAPEATEDATFTNQNVIDAFYQAGRKMGWSDPWGLLIKGGLTLGGLVGAGRNNSYDGARISKNPNLSEEEKSQIKQEMRTILGLSDDAEIASFSVGDDDFDPFLKGFDELIGVPSAMPKTEQLRLSDAENSLGRRVCRVWNRNGWVLNLIADILGIDIALAVAIPASETNTQGLDSDGRMTIHFEAHIFQEKWGNDNPDKFQQHFRYDADNPWQKQQWRADANGDWQNYHGKQDSEWGAFDLAMSLDETAAKQSISMGIPELLGTNYGRIGYNDVGEMYDAFASSERCQLIGLFDLIGGANQDSREIEALRDGDIDGFATLYKSGHEAAKYSALLRNAITAFQKLNA
ncbi:N-acetylmuramidase domain-containing protein [Anaerolineales bacterium HSG6]|nr:N-acetylmuramidase domain-containing protein [Anaerolineales bacterium HSG6]